MIREEAEALVAPYIISVQQYQAVSHADAKLLLGDTWFDKIMADPIRRLGPTSDTIYPWNVADALQLQDVEEPKT